MTTLTLDSAETQLNNLENLRANLFSTDIFTDKACDPNINLFTTKNYELDPEYYSVEEIINIQKNIFDI